MDQDYLDFEDDSDDERAESSEDEIDILLHGTPEQKRKLCRPGVVKKGDESSSEDEFEKEMNAELEGRVKEMERRRGSLSEAGCSSTSVMDLDSEEPVKYYDDVYFDSDEEDMVNKGNAAASKRLNQPTNDDLLYDPEADDEDEKWVEKQRRAYLPNATAGSSKKKDKRLPNSDAVLNCPACMVTLCLDCQRHDVYQNQYRAMFVSHCTVDHTELLKYPKPTNKKQSRKHSKLKTNDPGVLDNEDKFHPVKCDQCNTVVAVYDDDEIFHFFNVLASY